MSTTAVKKIAPLETEPSNRLSQVLPPSFGFLVRWGLFILIGIGIVLSVVFDIVQKWLWMRQLDYAGIFWTLLTVKWGIFVVASIISVLYLWLNLRFAARNIDLVDGESFFNKAFRFTRKAYKLDGIQETAYPALRLHTKKLPTL